MLKILLIHGPNLNLLGEREPSEYGYADSESILNELRSEFPEAEISYFQSNDEGELCSAIQGARNEQAGILINAGAYSHSSIAMADAIRAIRIPVISVHISHIYQREDFRHRDIVGEACQGAIVGLGTPGYKLALECLLDMV